MENPPAQPTVVSTPASPPPPKKPRSFSSQAILGATTIVSLIVAVFFFWQNQSLQAEIDRMTQVEPVSPSALQTPTTSVTTTPSDSPSPTTSINNLPVVSSPQANAVISSPLQIQGTVPAGWMFEGVFPVKLVDQARELITQVQGREVTPGSWQQGAPVAFTANLTFSAATNANRGYLILTNANPSGLPENELTFEVPIRFR